MIPRILWYAALVSPLASPVWCAEFVVTKLADDGPGSLRDAVNQANAADDADTIKFDFSALPGGGQRVINLTSGPLVINRNVMIMGPGPKDLVVQRSTDEGTPEFRNFDVTFSAGIREVMISGMTIRGGVGSEIRGGGALAVGAGNKVRLHDTVLENNTTPAPRNNSGGGAIFNAGQLTITASQFLNNSATMPVDIGSDRGGGAIYNVGTLTIDKSVFSGNNFSEGFVKTLGSGGAIFNADGGRVTITNSSFDGNNVSGFGGAIFNGTGGTMSLNKNTISGNSATDGGGVFNLGTIDQLKNNVISGNTNAPDVAENAPDLGLGFPTTGTINSASGNIVGQSTGHGLDPATNQLGVDPNLEPLKDNGGPTPSRKPDANGPAKDQGDGSTGFRFDQRGFFGNVGDGTDVGSVETGNRVFVAVAGTPAAWPDSANWLDGNVPGEGDPAWIVGGRTADLTGSGPINVDSINVGVSGDVGSADGAVVGSDVSITADSIDVGSAYGEQSPINSGNGTVTLTNATISTNNLLVGVSESSGEGVYTTAHGEVTLTSNVGGTSTLSVTGNAGVGSAVALAPGSKADAHGALEFDGQSADFGALFAGEALTIDGGRAETSSQVTISAGDNVTAGSLSTGTSFASGDSSSSIVDARVDITANDVFMVDGAANIGGAQISGAAAEQASADVANVWYSVTANQHTVAGGLRVGQVGASSFGMPGAELPTAHVGTVRADINVQTLNVLNNLEVASLFATGPSENSIDDVSVTIAGSDTEVSGVVTVGTEFLSDGASVVIGNASLDVEGGSFNVTETPPGFPSLRVGTIDKFSAGPELAQLLARRAVPGRDGRPGRRRRGGRHERRRRRSGQLRPGDARAGQ